MVSLGNGRYPTEAVRRGYHCRRTTGFSKPHRQTNETDARVKTVMPSDVAVIRAQAKVDL